MYIIYIAATPTSPYTVLETIDSSPNIAATKSNFASPTNPQLSPPTITRTSAIQSILFFFILFTSAKLMQCISAMRIYMANMHTYINLCIFLIVMDSYIDKIDQILAQNPQGLSVTEIAEKLKLNRNSAARYLDVLHHQGSVKERKIGPAKLYVKSSTLPFSVQLNIFSQAMDEASCGITVGDTSKEGFPLIYANDAFHKMTGYSQEEVIGKNCRFLQGSKRDMVAVKKIRQALKNKKAITIVLKNYKKDGTLFYNELHLSPIQSKEGQITHYVGIQTDVSYQHKIKRNGE